MIIMILIIRKDVFYINDYTGCPIEYIFDSNKRF